MNMRPLLLPVLLVVALLGLSPSTESLARPHGFSDGQGYGRGCPGRVCPGLSAEQQQKYEAIVDEYAKKMELIEDQLFVKRQELRALQNAATPNVEAVRSAATELRKLSKQLRTLHTEMSQRLQKEVGKPANVEGMPAGHPCGEQSGAGRGKGQPAP